MEIFIHNFYYSCYADEFQIIIPTTDSLMNFSPECLTEVRSFLLDFIQPL